MLGAQGTRADNEKEMKDRSFNKSANEIIGKKVTNAQDEDLGKVQDIIINVDAGTAPYAVIATGGVFGANRSKIAVSLGSLHCSADGKELVMSVTKEQLQAASKTATGAWAPVANSEWARRVDAFYGQPAPRDRFARDSNRTSLRNRSNAAVSSRMILIPAKFLSQTVRRVSMRRKV